MARILVFRWSLPALALLTLAVPPSPAQEKKPAGAVAIQERLATPVKFNGFDDAKLTLGVAPATRGGTRDQRRIEASGDLLRDWLVAVGHDENLDVSTARLAETFQSSCQGLASRRRDDHREGRLFTHGRVPL